MLESELKAGFLISPSMVFPKIKILISFYKKIVQPIIHGVNLGSKCIIMMYVPNASWKSCTMFRALSNMVSYTMFEGVGTGN